MLDISNSQRTSPATGAVPHKCRSHRLLVVIDGTAERARERRSTVLPSTHLLGVDIDYVCLQSLLMELLMHPSCAAHTPAALGPGELQSDPRMLSHYRLILVGSEEVGTCLRSLLPSLSERIFRLDYFGDLGREDDLSHWSACLSHMMNAAPC